MELLYAAFKEPENMTPIKRYIDTINLGHSNYKGNVNVLLNTDLWSRNHQHFLSSITSFSFAFIFLPFSAFLHTPEDKVLFLEVLVTEHFKVSLNFLLQHFFNACLNHWYKPVLLNFTLFQRLYIQFTKWLVAVLILRLFIILIGDLKS